jgi:hypothetical protein
LLKACLLVGFLAACGANSRGAFKPIPGPTATSVPVRTNLEPFAISFTDLQAAPDDHLFRRLQVSGDFTRLNPPPCLLHRGPKVSHALVSDGLRLDLVGFERILRLVPDGTPMTLVGVWMRYEGEVGCGKKSSKQAIWYLSTQQIIAPNPLPNFGLASADDIGGGQSSPGDGGIDIGPPEVIGGGSTPGPSPTPQTTAPPIGGTASAQATATLASQASATATQGTPGTATVTPSAAPTGATATATQTPQPGAATPSPAPLPTETSAATNTPFITSTPIPPQATFTPGDPYNPGPGY